MTDDRVCVRVRVRLSRGCQVRARVEEGRGPLAVAKCNSLQSRMLYRL